MMQKNKPQDIESLEQTLDVTVLTTSSESMAPNIDIYDRGESKNPNSSIKTFREQIIHIMTMNIIPDHMVQSTILQRMNLIVSVELFRLVKFCILTYSLILLTIPFIRWIGWENDKSYSVQSFLLYDLTSVTLDSIAFYIVGRLYQRQGIDRLFPHLIPIIISCIYTSWVGTVWFMRNSFSIYNMRCVWPWQLYIYFGCFGFVVLILIFFHVRVSFKDHSLFQRAVEFSITLVIFIVPFLNNSNLHLHHWYLAMHFAMHSNREEWWSQFSMALGWGWYINGIAAYGRDPILGCSAIKFYSIGNKCGNSTTPRVLTFTNSLSPRNFNVTRNSCH